MDTCFIKRKIGVCHYEDGKPSDLCRHQSIPPKDPATAVAIVSSINECKEYGNVIARMNDDCSEVMCHATTPKMFE
jgi:hypothetical protein